jgi:hypothetical protein
MVNTGEQAGIVELLRFGLGQLVRIRLANRRIRTRTVAADAIASLIQCLLKW